MAVWLASYFRGSSSVHLSGDTAENILARSFGKKCLEMLAEIAEMIYDTVVLRTVWQVLEAWRRCFGGDSWCLRDASSNAQCS